MHCGVGPPGRRRRQGHGRAVLAWSAHGLVAQMMANARDLALVRTMALLDNHPEAAQGLVLVTWDGGWGRPPTRMPLSPPSNRPLTKCSLISLCTPRPEGLKSAPPPTEIPPELPVFGYFDPFRAVFQFFPSDFFVRLGPLSSKLTLLFLGHIVPFC